PCGPCGPCGPPPPGSGTYSAPSHVGTSPTLLPAGIAWLSVPLGLFRVVAISPDLVHDEPRLRAEVARYVRIGGRRVGASPQRDGARRSVRREGSEGRDV